MTTPRIVFAGVGDVWVGQSMNRSRLCDRASCNVALVCDRCRTALLLWSHEALSRDAACVETLEQAFSVVEGLYTALDVGCSHV